MAQNLAVTTTLATVKANIRSKTGSISTQDSLLIEPQLNDIVHFAIQFVRTLGGKFVDAYYMQKKLDLTFAGTTPDFTASITALNIADANAVRLYHATLKEIPVVTNQMFNALRTVYAATDIGTTRGFATVSLTSATPAVLTVYLFSNIASFPTNVEISFPRNPVKVTTETDTVDIPEQFIPFVVDTAAKDVFLKLKQQPPADLEARFMSQLNLFTAQYNLKVSPQNS